MASFTRSLQQAARRRSLALTPPFHPFSLFSGVQGVAFDPLDPATLWADTAGSTPAVPGGRVKRVDDISGNGHHKTQSTDTACPLMLGCGGLFFDVDQLVTPSINFSSTNAITVVTAVRKRTGADSAAGVVVELTANGYSTNGGFYVCAPNGSGGTQDFGFAARGTSGLAKIIAGYDAPTADVLSVLFDIGGNAIAARINGVPVSLSTLVGTTLGTGNFANAALYFGARSGLGSPLKGNLGRTMVYGGNLFADAAGLANAEAWVVRPSEAVVAFLGDSTTAVYGGGVVTSTGDHVDCEPRIIAVAGHTIAQQKAAWTARADKADFAAAVVRCGLNDILFYYLENAATQLGRLQNLIDTMLSDGVPAVVVSAMTPCKQRLMGELGATNGATAYQKWLDVNEGIAGNGPTPITGPHGRVIAHVAQLNDGSGNLAAAYELPTPDHIHPNDKGRAIIGAAENAVLGALL